MKSLFFALVSLLFICSCKQDLPATPSAEPAANQETSTSFKIAQAIALKNGIQEWDKVQKIAFTFNVDRNGKTVAKRSWIWEPKTDDVVMLMNGDSTTYNRTKIDSSTMAADRGFINDKFWLLAPYQLVWDKGTTLSTQDSVMTPISLKSSKKLTILYGDEGGYTPGDAYDFYYQDDLIITEWVFRKSNANTASMTTTFEEYKNYEGLHIATSHKGTANELHLYFTDIEVTK